MRLSWLRISVRTLLVLVLVVGGGLGWFLHQARVQSEAVASIRHAGGNVLYDWQFENGKGLRGGKPRGWDWWVRQFGVDCLDHVTCVTGSGRATDDEMYHLGRLTQLDTLALDESRVSDQGLAQLDRLKGIRWLTIIQASNNFTDARLLRLRRLKTSTRLQGLNLAKSAVTDGGLGYFEGLTELNELWLSDTKVTDKGMEHLAQLSGLRVLDLDGTQVTDTGLAELTGLVNLTKLYLRRTRVTDAGVRELQRTLPSLKVFR
jgi:hypothetical protein